MFVSLKTKSKNFFFEKKKQKTFVNLGQWTFHERGLKESKFFLLLFCSQKRRFFLSFSFAALRSKR